MNEGVQNFIRSMGVLCEQWTIVYRSFISQGLSKDEALIHTKAFMETVFADARNNGGNTE